MLCPNRAPQAYLTIRLSVTVDDTTHFYSKLDPPTLKIPYSNTLVAIGTKPKSWEKVEWDA